jgi:hypothetical protein
MKTVVAGKTPKGTDYYKFQMPESEYSSLSNDYAGLCIFCGEEHSGKEPDARKDECESCGKKGVYGMEELIVMGLISFGD